MCLRKTKPFKRPPANISWPYLEHMAISLDASEAKKVSGSSASEREMTREKGGGWSSKCQKKKPKNGKIKQLPLESSRKEWDRISLGFVMRSLALFFNYAKY